MNDDDDFEERAAIIQHDAKLPQAAAEQAAADGAKRLRPYQVSGIEQLREVLRQGKKRVVFYLPTGGGKTEVAAAIMEGAVGKGRRGLFVCHRIELVKQTSRRFRAAALYHGILQGQNSRGEWNNLMIGSIQTVNRRGIDDLDIIIVDEAHGCAGTKAYHAMFEKFKDIPIIGLTATPFSKGLAKEYPGLSGPLFEDIVVAATIPDLIRDGFLVDCDIYGPSEPDLSKVKVVAGDYQQDQLAVAVNTSALVGDIVTHWQRLGGNHQTICFATDIAHSKNIVAQFVAAGISADHVDAYTKEPDRDRIIGGFREGKFKVLSNCAVLAEGFDAPAVHVMILARPTKSLVRYIQMAGRVLRPFPGKEKAIILDHSGTCRRLGFPTDELPLILDDGKPKISTGSAKKEEALPKLCAKCHYLKPPKIHECPKCGFAPEKQSKIKPLAGDLQKLERKRGRSLPDDPRTLYAELKMIQQQRGYASGWLSHKWKEITGTWPPKHYAHIQAEEPSPGTKSWVRSRAIAWAKSRRNPDQIGG